MISASDDDKAVKALRWAWTNATGRLPDSNTMTPAEIEKYWRDYQEVLRVAIRALTGSDPR